MKYLISVIASIALAGCVSQSVNLKINSPEQQDKNRQEWNKRFPGMYPPLSK